MNRDIKEQELLNTLDIPDFRHMTKDKVMSFASMLQNMDPEVAKKAIEQFPEFASMALQALSDYKGVMEKTLDENSESSKQCFNVFNEVLSALKQCASKEDLPFEEKQYYIEKMMDIARMAESKDSENKGFNWKMIGLASLVVLSVIGVGAGALGGKFNLSLPKLK